MLIKTIAIAVVAFAGFSVSGSVPACELVDLASAEQVLGPGTTNVDGGAEPSLCMYQAADGWALMTVQVQSIDMYDVIRIQEPNTPLDVGDRGRYHVNENGVVSVQFVKGDFSVTMGVTPRIEPPHEFQDALFEIAGVAASRIP